MRVIIQQLLFSISTDFIVVLIVFFEINACKFFRSARFRSSISTDFFLATVAAQMSKAAEISSKDNENKYLWAAMAS